MMATPVASHPYAEMCGISASGMEEKCLLVLRLLREQNRKVKAFHRTEPEGPVDQELHAVHTLLSLAENAAAGEVWQSINIPTAILTDQLRLVFQEAAVCVPNWYAKTTYRDHARIGLTQDLLVGSAGSSTAFHVDSPLPIATTILVLTGSKQVIGWPLCKATKFDDEYPPVLTEDDDDRTSFSPAHWALWKERVSHVSGSWAVTLGPGQHVTVPPLHVHAVFNDTFCVSLNTTPASAIQPQFLPQIVKDLAIILARSKGDAKPYIGGDWNVGEGFGNVVEAAINAKIRELTDGLRSDTDITAIMEWLTDMLGALSLVARQRHFSMTLRGFSIKRIRTLHHRIHQATNVDAMTRNYQQEE